MATEQTSGQSEGEGASASIADVVNTATDIITQAASGALGAGNGGGNDAPVGAGPADSFVGLPIEALICGPIIAAARGQQQLTAVYVDTVMKLAYKDGKEEGGTNQLAFTYERPVINQDHTVSSQQCTVNAPLLSLVPVPAFTMDELVVDFKMEVKQSDSTDDKTHEDVQAKIGFNSWWGLDVSITGNVSSDSEHKRSTDSSATYTIHARAVQQPPSEGMAKLTALFAQAMEPIPTSSKS